MADDRPAEALEKFHEAVVALIDALEALCEKRDGLRPQVWRKRAPPKNLISSVAAAADRVSAAAAPIESDLEHVATFFPGQIVGGCLGLGWHLALLAWARRRVVGVERNPEGRAKLRDRVDEAFWTPNFEAVRLTLKRERGWIGSFSDNDAVHVPARTDGLVVRVVEGTIELDGIELSARATKGRVELLRHLHRAGPGNWIQYTSLVGCSGISNPSQLIPDFVKSDSRMEHVLEYGNGRVRLLPGVPVAVIERPLPKGR
ncbi:MAG: hypothetical protein ACF8XB_03500 [Planctomycetota bacterium JB042]